MKPWRFGLAASLLAGVVMAGEPDLIARQNLKYLLQHDCGSCHGMRLTGGLGPALTSSALERYPVNYVADTILHGRGGTAMPAWRGLLTAHEARWLAEFLIFGEDQ
jgi:cytochrome c55X